MLNMMYGLISAFASNPSDKTDATRTPTSASDTVTEVSSLLCVAENVRVSQEASKWGSKMSEGLRNGE